MVQSIEYYKDCPEIAGISLYTHGMNVNAGLSFVPAANSSDVYFQQFAQSWGQIWIRDSWMEFKNWYIKNCDKPVKDVKVPEFVSSWSKSSWLKYHIKYCIENNIIKTKYCKYCGSEKGKCLHPEICGKYRVFKSLEKFGFDKQKIGSVEIYDEYNRIKKLLTEEYKNHIDDKLLNEKYNYTSGLANFHKLLKSMEIETKPIKERLSETYLLGKKNIQSSTNFKSEWHTTWDNNEVYLRSSYEIDYANELDKNHIKYEVEHLRIKYYDTIENRYRCSIPDFYLPDTNTIVEIKSKYTLNIQNMKDKFLAYKNLGYDMKLILEHKEVDIEKL
jgi:hypothetical protein